MASFSRRRTRAPIPAPKKKTSNCNDDDIVCQVCNLGNFPTQLLLCDNCNKGYHLFCLTPILTSVPESDWFCPSCSHNTKYVRKKRKRGNRWVALKKKWKLLPFVPSDDSKRRLEQMASLAKALAATKAEFSNELTYVPGMAPRDANSSALEHGGVQVLSKEDTESLNLCRSMMERGEYPPLMVVHDPLEGFTVEADKPIEALTIITEYVGDVDFLKNRENDGMNSMMTLLSASDPSQSLVICPDKRSNIARFISGINNYTRDGKKKQNVRSARFNVDGECRVFLIAKRYIAKGERLYYDYNGYDHEYPTAHFV